MRRRLLLLSIVALMCVYAGLALAAWWNRDRPFVDEAGLKQLGAAAFKDGVGSDRYDWPQWRGPNRDGISRETGLLLDWPADGPKRLWERSAGQGYSSLAIASGRAFTLVQDGDDEAVVCWDAEKGDELWRFRYPSKFEESHGNGPRSTPTIDGDRIYAVGAMGLLHCLKTNPASPGGEVVWKHDLLTDLGGKNIQWGVSFSPLIEGDLIYTMPGGKGSALAAFDKLTGELRWKHFDDQAGYSSPIAATIAGRRQIIFFTATRLLAVTPEKGELLWEFPWETGFGVNAATPIVRGDYVFISSGYDQGCAMLYIEPGKGNDRLHAKLVYRNSRMRNHFPSSVLVGEYIYGFDDTLLRCMEFRTGKATWRERGFGRGSLIAVAGHLIILGENGKLALAEAFEDSYREKASFQFSTGKCWTAPALAHGLLYVRDEQKVACFELRKK